MIYDKISSSYKVKKVYNIHDEMPTFLAFRLKKVETTSDVDVYWFYNGYISEISDKNEKFSLNLAGREVLPNLQSILIYG